MSADLMLAAWLFRESIGESLLPIISKYNLEMLLMQLSMYCMMLSTSVVHAGVS